MAVLMQGKALAESIREHVRGGVVQYRERHGRVPQLAIVMAGDDPAGLIYTGIISRTFEKVGMRSLVRALPASAQRQEVEALIKELNGDDEVDGVLVQMPLPAGVPRSAVSATLDPTKDVDGITRVNAGLLFLGEEALIPNTPLGGLELLLHYGVPIAGKRAVVVGRSNVVGRPMALLLLARDAVVTICHSRAGDITPVLKEADIVAIGIGKPRWLTGEMIKPGAAIVDFGINEMPDRNGGATIVGDVDAESAAPVAGWLTPVPGGTGPVTNAVLLRSTLAAANLRAGQD